MPLTICWSAKGGSGTTVVAAGVALASGSRSLLVDLAGELPTVLGIPEPSGQGLSDWFRSPAPAGSVLDLAIDVTPSARLVASGPERIDPSSTRWSELGEHLAASALHVVIDAGCGLPPEGLTASARRPRRQRDDVRVVGRRLVPSTRSLLVTRACYLSLVRAARLPRPDGIVLVEEPGRALTAADVATSIGAPVVARVPLDPAVARAVDAGLLAASLPKGMLRSLRDVARREVPAESRREAIA